MRRWIAFLALSLLLGAVTTWMIAWVAAPIRFLSIRGTDWTNDDQLNLGRVSTSRWTVSYEAHSIGSDRWQIDPLGADLLQSANVAGVLSRDAEEVMSRPSSGDSVGLQIVRSGWPLRAMVSSSENVMIPGFARYSPLLGLCTGFEQGVPALLLDVSLFEAGGRAARTGRAGRIDRAWSLGPLHLAAAQEFGALPWRPLIPGFLVDTLAWAVVWGVATLSTVVWPFLRRRRRRRRKQCESCGFSREGSSIDAPAMPGRCNECGRSPRITAPLFGRRLLAVMACGVMVLSAATALWGWWLTSTVAAELTPLARAARRGDTKSVRELLAQPEPPPVSVVDALNPRRDVMPLLAAIAGGHLESIELLLDAGVPLSTAGRNELQPILLAAHLGDEVIIDALLGRMPGDEGDATLGTYHFRALSLELLEVAARRGDGRTIAKVFEKRPKLARELAAATSDRVATEVWMSAEEILQRAAMAQRTDALSILLDRLGAIAEADPSGKSSELFRKVIVESEALRYALRWSRAAQAQLLLDAGALPKGEDSFPHSPLVGAAESRDLAMIDWVFDRGLENQVPDTALVSAAITVGWLEGVERLVARGVDLNGKAVYWSSSPLEAAIVHRSPATVVRRLLELGANPAIACEGHSILKKIPWETVDRETIEALRPPVRIGEAPPNWWNVGFGDLMRDGRDKAVARTIELGFVPRDVDVATAQFIVDGKIGPRKDADPQAVHRATRLVLGTRTLPSRMGP